jgi:hypothetical protein
VLRDKGGFKKVYSRALSIDNCIITFRQQRIELRISRDFMPFLWRLYEDRSR